MSSQTLRRPSNQCLEAADDALMAAVACQRRLVKAARESRQTINALAAARDALRDKTTRRPAAAGRRGTKRD